MAAIALVMTYPYEAFSGGEQAYVGALRRFLISRGHRVDTLVSDISRGRANPFLSLRRAGSGQIKVRRTISIGTNRYLGYDMALIKQAVSAVTGRRSSGGRTISSGERRWLNEVLRRERYDAIILMWDACEFDLSATNKNVLALRGFFSNQDYSLGQFPPAEIPPTSVAALAKYRLVGLNNKWEIKAFDIARKNNNAIYVGMGFKRPMLSPASEVPVVLFVGADTLHNRKSVAWFINSVWPFILAECPEAEFRIVGSVCTSLNKLPKGITAVGRVENLSAQYADAQVVVSPIVSGSAGVKTKVAEALAHSKPLVTTSLGVDPGDPGQMDDNVDVVDNAEGFAIAVNRLLSNQEYRQERERRSALAFERVFSNNAAYSELIEALSL